MPISLALDPKRNLIIGSLKGRVWKAFDQDKDSLHETCHPISDELATPYGIHASDSHVDVVVKYGIVRLSNPDRNGKPKSHQIIASGWGHTDDYHDWAVGLPQDRNGNYYVVLPCQQDQRSTSSAKFRGKLLKYSPRKPTKSNPDLYAVQVVSTGHRFPMGIAINKAGSIFVTDNQGNYNPFNELNHVAPNANDFFGFINKLESKNFKSPKLKSPAINIPHPWTRSVNGITFLESEDDKFGPFEGHLIGCEYDTQRLIRMSIENVNGVMQGASFPFSYPKPKSGPPLLGPIACTATADGEIFVGNIRDSGWGLGPNIGNVVRMEPALKQLPCGIANITAKKDGFEVTFTKPFDRKLAATKSNYVVSSYRRISTPQYGGSDVDRRSEELLEAKILDDKTVKLRFAELRAGFNYEFRLKSLSPNADAFFPAEGFYTLNEIPGK